MVASARKIDSTSLSVLEMLRDSLVAGGRYNPNDVVRPIVILWADPESQWVPVIPHLQKLLPELLVLGEYNPEKKMGPAIWLRCVIERALPEVLLPEWAVPIIYLPGIGRQILRAVHECPDPLKPLVELLYRGVSWVQKNGKDWSVEDFLVSEDGGLDLDVAEDTQTKAAMITALPELVTRKVASLRGGRLESSDFDKLMVADTVKDLLLWQNDPHGISTEWNAGKWSAFRSRCKTDYGFDPEKDGEITAGELLGKKGGSWSQVWDRFAESPALYAGIPGLLRKAKPVAGGAFDDLSSWPQHNEALENDLRQQLKNLENLAGNQARQQLLELEKTHSQRREWVWACLGQAPLAMALESLAKLAEKTENSLGGATIQAMAELYAKGSWEADAAVLDALASVKSAADYQAVTSGIRSMYLPWLQSSSEHFQRLLGKEPLPTYGETGTESVKPVKGCVVLFADGLRWDIANRLVKLMQESGWEPHLSPRWAAQPTVTATAKPALSAVAKRLKGVSPGEDFLPEIDETGQTLTPERFKKLLEVEKIQFLSAGETGDSAGSAWTEQGELDSLGHSLQAKLAYRVQEQVEQLIERVITLLDAGWKEIRIVTDHGWLLVPGGLPKIDLPKYLTESRWSRCASIKDGSHVECPTVPWYWNKTQHVAVAPGVACFIKGNEYAHGGASLQECLIPVITIKSSGKAGASTATIAAVKWAGLRCKVSIGSADRGMKVDLRTKSNDPESSIAQPKAVSADGTASLLVEDDSLEGTTAVVVLMDAAGNVIGKQASIIGGED
jgi:hypothetical protein